MNEFENINQSTPQEEENAQNENMTYLSREEIGEFIKRLSGKTPEGESKVIISYQSYATEEPEDSVDKERIYSTIKPHIELSIDMQDPRFYVMDIIFKSWDDPELKLLWGRLQRFKRNMTDNIEKTWVFYFNILEKASVSQQTLERDTLLVMNIFNPTLFYLTREIPDMLVQDTLSGNGDMQGGNIIRMLVPTELLTFQVTDDIDTSEVKGEVMREEAERDYINNNNESNWEE